MLLNIGIILLSGLLGSKIFQKLKLAPIIGMLIAGVIISPNLFGLVNGDISELSNTLRKIALVVILTRAGLSLDLEKLKEVGVSAMLISFLPASFEMLSVSLLAHLIFKIPYLDAAILGSVLSAVSPAIVVPRMISLINEGYGKDKHIPEIILAGSSIDDVYVMVFFTSFISLKQSGEISLLSFLNIPISITLGALMGIVIGFILSILFENINLSNSYRVILTISLSFMIMVVEDIMKAYLPFSALICIIVLAMQIRKLSFKTSKYMLDSYSRIWQVFEIFLFVLVGITVDLRVARQNLFPALLLIILALIFRMLGVYVSLIKSKLNKKEKLFTAIAYLPKATVQAAIGPIALQMGLSNGDLILSISVIAILFTASLGAILTDKTYKKLLVKG